MDANRVYWTSFQTNTWKLYLAATTNGLCYVGSPDASFEEVEYWVRKHLPQHTLVEDQEFMNPYATELQEYLDVQRTEFSVPLDLQGTPFQQTVWRALLDIPHGETVSYSEMAERILKPTAVRAVSSAIGANPVMIVVPCHRVLAKTGKLTGFRGGLDMKEQLLVLEQREA